MIINSVKTNLLLYKVEDVIVLTSGFEIYIECNREGLMEFLSGFHKNPLVDSNSLNAYNMLSIDYASQSCSVDGNLRMESSQ